MFTVNEKELEYDIFDADKAELFESEMDSVVKKMSILKQSEKELTFAESIRAQCEAVTECFDNLFGAGAAAKIFDGKVNLVLALQSFEELADGISAQKAKIGQMAKDAAAKYKPMLQPPML